jgi:hypothetical protein
MAATTTRPRSETAILRAGVLDLGARLGWDQARVEAFGRAVTGRPWRCCGSAEFHQMLRAYAALARRARATWIGGAAGADES